MVDEILEDEQYNDCYYVGERFADLLGELIELKMHTFINEKDLVAFFDGLRDNLILEP